MSGLPVNPSPMLCAVPRWVLWRYARKHGSDVLTKVPTHSDGHSNARWMNPHSWLTYEQAIDAYNKVSGYWRAGGGLGLVLLAEDDVAVVDMDGARCAETGSLAGWAAQIVSEFDSYTEVSVSGSGLHLFAKAAPDFWRPQSIKMPRANSDPVAPGREPLCEVFVGNHYITISGDRLDGTPGRLSANPNTWASLAKRLRVSTERPEPVHRDYDDADLEVVEDALRHFTSDDLDRAAWIGIGIAIKDAFGEDGRDVWLSWLARSPHDDGDVSEDTWAGLPNTAETVSLGTVFHHAIQNGWRPPWQTNARLDFDDDLEPEPLDFDEPLKSTESDDE